MVGHLVVTSLAVLLGLCAAGQLFAYLMRLDAALGMPLWRDGWVALYSPHQILVWAWWWGRLNPDVFLWSGVVGVATTGWTLWQLWPTPPTTREAHWATWRELRQAHCLGRMGSGIVLGQRGGRVLRYTGGLHCFYVGRTGGGKSNALTTTLLEYPHSALVLDPKHELYPRTAGYRATLGPVLRLAPTEEGTDGYNPWGLIDVDSPQAFREVEILSYYLLQREERGQESAASIHFRGLATQFLNGVSLYGLTTGLATCGEEFADLVTRAPWAGLVQAMREHAHPVVQSAAEIASRAQGEELGGLQTTLARALSLFDDPQVAQMTRQTTFPLTLLREAQAPCTLYWHVPFRDQARLRRLTRLLFHQILDYCTETHFLVQYGQAAQAHPLLWVCEELPSLHYFPLASEGLNYLRGYGIQLLVLTPSMAEVVKEYGEHHNFLEGTYIQCVFGVSSTKIAQLFTDSIGEHEVSVTRTTRQQGRRSTSTEHRKEALLDATGLRKLAPGQVLVLAGEHAVLAQQTPFYGHWRWRHRSQIPVPTRGGEDGGQ